MVSIVTKETPEQVFVKILVTALMAGRSGIRSPVRDRRFISYMFAVSGTNNVKVNISVPTGTGTMEMVSTARFSVCVGFCYVMTPLKCF